MFKGLLEWGAYFLLALTIVSQLIVPLFVPSLDLFWIFKSKKEIEAPKGVLPDLDATISHLKDDTLAKTKALDDTLHKVDVSIEELTKVRDIKH